MERAACCWRTGRIRSDGHFVAALYSVGYVEQLGMRAVYPLEIRELEKRLSDSLNSAHWMCRSLVDDDETAASDFAESAERFIKASSGVNDLWSRISDLVLTASDAAVGSACSEAVNSCVRLRNTILVHSDALVDWKTGQLSDGDLQRRFRSALESFEPLDRKRCLARIEVECARARMNCTTFVTKRLQRPSSAAEKPDISERDRDSLKTRDASKRDKSRKKQRGGRPRKWDKLWRLCCDFESVDPGASDAKLVAIYNRKHPRGPKATVATLRQVRYERLRRKRGIRHKNPLRKTVRKTPQ
jgi:hypothetical protein